MTGHPDRGHYVALVWAGMVLGVSFLATPAKFLTPSLPLPTALAIGRQTFRIFGRVEMGLAALLGVAARRPLALAPGVIVLAQCFWLRPRLAAQRPQTAAPAEHNTYVVLEAAKLAALLALGCRAGRRH